MYNGMFHDGMGSPRIGDPFWMYIYSIGHDCIMYGFKKNEDGTCATSWTHQQMLPKNTYVVMHKYDFNGYSLKVSFTRSGRAVNSGTSVVPLVLFGNYDELKSAVERIQDEQKSDNPTVYTEASLEPISRIPILGKKDEKRVHRKPYLKVSMIEDATKLLGGATQICMTTIVNSVLNGRKTGEHNPGEHRFVVLDIHGPAWYTLAGIQEHFPRLVGHAERHIDKYRDRLWYALMFVYTKDVAFCRIMVMSKYNCGHCGFTGLRNQLKKCGHCLKERYCGIECQESEWEYHKLYCIDKDGNHFKTAEERLAEAEERRSVKTRAKKREARRRRRARQKEADNVNDNAMTPPG